MATQHALSRGNTSKFKYQNTLKSKHRKKLKKENYKEDDDMDKP